MKAEQRKQLLGVVLAGTLGVTLWTAWRESGAEDVAVVAARPLKRVAYTHTVPVASDVQGAASVLASLQPRASAPAELDDLFGVPPTPAPVVQAVASAPAPQAPALPFQVLGRYENDGDKAVFLQYNDRNLVARVGDTIDDLYQVESLQDGVLTLVYLPLHQKQTLQVGSADTGSNT